jgi:hypothetical protein
MEREEGNEHMQRVIRFGGSLGKTIAEALFVAAMGAVTGYSAYLLVGPGVHQAIVRVLF